MRLAILLNSKADICVYVDVDMSCEQPLDRLLSRVTKDCVILGESNTHAFEVNNGIIIKVGNCKVLGEMVQKLWANTKKCRGPTK